jgi:8-oxo-dGTP diphosphatase
MHSDQPVTLRLATKALIVNDQGKILVLREAVYDDGTNTGRYHLPGGRINPGEAFIDGLRREVIEETGLEIEGGKPLYVGEWWPVIKDIPNQIVAIFFVCKPLTTQVRLSEEHDEFKWISPEEALELDLMEPEDKVIETYIKDRTR